jgi:hypothetical protein
MDDMYVNRQILFRWKRSFLYTQLHRERQKLCINSSIQIFPEQSTGGHCAANYILLRNLAVHHPRLNQLTDLQPPSVCVAVMLCTCIWLRIPVGMYVRLPLYLSEIFVVFLSLSKRIVGPCLETGHSLLLPNHCQVTIHNHSPISLIRSL